MATGNFVTQAAFLPFTMAGAAARLGMASMRGMYRMGVESAKMVGGMALDSKETVEDAASDVRSSFEDWGDRLEDRVEDTLERLGVPVRADLDGLNRRIDDLTAYVRDQTRKAERELEEEKEPARRVFHVTPFNGEWQVKEAGTEAASGLYETKDAAMQAARGLAHAAEPSQLIVHRADGTIQTSYTYGELEDGKNEEEAN